MAIGSFLNAKNIFGSTGSACSSKSLEPSHVLLAIGLTALEAMACGTPPIIANRSSLPEVVGEAGVMFEPDDVSGLALGVERSLEDEKFREEQTHKGLAQAKKYSWNVTAKRTMEIYERSKNSQ